MANNGFLVGGSCSTDPSPLIYALTCGTYPNATIMARFTDSSGNYAGGKIACYYINASGSTIYVGQKFATVSPNCEIPGPPLTEVEQIEAINGLFPHAVAILAIAWGLRYIRVLVAEWLKERNASD